MLRIRKASLAVPTVALAGLLVALPAAQAGNLNVGAGLRTSFNIVDNAAPGGTSDSRDFSLDSVRLYTSGKLQDNIGFEFNTGYDAVANSVEVLDAVAKFEHSEHLNVWAGRFLPPSDRSNLSGPYFLNAWNFPAAQRYPAIFAGRDEGIAVHGIMASNKSKYAIGIFEGPDAMNAGGEDDTLISARFTFNFLDAEAGYYNSSTYYGAKEVLAVGVVAQSFDGGTGTSIDVLYESKVGIGTLTAELGSYAYDEFAGSDGDGFFVLGSYLFSNGVQPMVRIQNFDIDGWTDAAVGPGTLTPVPETDVLELGVNYIIDGHNARVSFVFGDREIGNVSDDFINFGLQLQI